MSDASPRTVVCDTGPLISLEKIPGGYRFIRRLYDRLIVPPAVLRELTAGEFESEEAYLRHFEIEDLIEVRHPAEAPGPETRRLASQSRSDQPPGVRGSPISDQ